MGARPMARVIQEHIKRPLAEELLFGKLTDGGHVRVDVDADGLVLIAEPTLRELEHLPQERNTELAGPSSGKPDREA
jgi:ATP-dependent Clp protease ATP-binding subunit ClpA